jgi:hypothetical protein
LKIFLKENPIDLRQRKIVGMSKKLMVRKVMELVSTISSLMVANPCPQVKNSSCASAEPFYVRTKS